MLKYRRLFVMLLVAAALAMGQGAAFGWKFASIADSRGGSNGVNTAELGTIVNRIKAENVDLVIFQGDAVDGGGCNDACIGSQMDTWLGIMNTLNCPWYYTPGNHEVISSTVQENVLRAKVNMPTNGPAGDLEMAYSFDHENAHFVALNCEHYGQQHRVQLSWLASDMAGTTQPHIFVMTHEPAYPAGPHSGSSLDVYASERDDLWAKMTTAGVRTFFCGHEHLYQRSTHGNIFQVINGTCGAPINTGVANTIAQYHYVIYTITGNSVHCETKNDAGSLLDSWDYAVASPTTVTCDGAKLLNNGGYVRLYNKIVTYVSGTAAYLEELDRSAGFRVTGVSGVAVGDKVTAIGTLATNSSGEREIQGGALRISSGNTIPKPLGMTNESLIGGPRGNNPGAYESVGCNTSSLYVRVFGKVTKIGTGPYAGMFYVDDGSGINDGTSWASTQNVGVRVKWTGTVTLNSFVQLNGIVSAFKNGSTKVCRQILCTDPVVPAIWTAYNDVVYDATVGCHPALKANVTTFNIGAGGPGPSSGHLLDFATGADTGITATLTQSGNVNWQPSCSSGGTDCNSGTDAYTMFNPNTASLYGVVFYGSGGWYVDLAFSGLNPSKAYEFATSANRANSGYTDRVTKFTLSGADSFTNASSSGVTVTNGDASIAFNTGYNTVNGYLVKWVGIAPGTDGTFTVRAEAGTGQNNAYAFSAFMLKQP